MTCTIWLLGYKYFVHFSRWTKCLSDGVKNANIRTVHKFLKNFSNDTDVTQQKLISELVVQEEKWIYHFDSESEQQSMQCNEWPSQNCHFITLHYSIFSMANANQWPLNAQNIYSPCACRVLSLATIRSKYYFNFILNRTRSDRELFDRPSYILWRCHSIELRICIFCKTDQNQNNWWVMTVVVTEHEKPTWYIIIRYETWWNETYSCRKTHNNGSYWWVLAVAENPNFQQIRCNYILPFVSSETDWLVELCLPVVFLLYMCEC